MTSAQQAPALPCRGRFFEHAFFGSLVSTVVNGKSHWLNRVRVGLKSVDLDLTGDQFGRPSVQITEKGTLYPGERLRQPQELTSETIHRAKKLASKVGIKSIDNSINCDH